MTNGMSQHSRAEFNANSGLVVDIDPARDYPGGPLAGIAFQRKWESLAFTAGGSDYHAPGQKVGDLVAGRASLGEFGSVIPSYQPGVRLTDLGQCLPDYVMASIREALPVFGRQIPGYDHPDVIMTGVETRTSSPVRIRRGVDLQSVNTRGLYPAGEGAGYAGGILSAAVDGIRVAEALALTLLPHRHKMTVKAPPLQGRGWGGGYRPGPSAQWGEPPPPTPPLKGRGARFREAWASDRYITLVQQNVRSLTPAQRLRTFRTLLKSIYISDI